MLMKNNRTIIYLIAFFVVFIAAGSILSFINKPDTSLSIIEKDPGRESVEKKLQVTDEQDITAKSSFQASTGSSVNRDELHKAINLAAGYLDKFCDENGRFTYTTNTNPKITPRPAYNILRHCGTIYSLTMYEQWSQGKKVREVIKRAIEYLKKESIGVITGREDLLAVWSLGRFNMSSAPNQVKLGGTGLGLVALASMEKIEPGTTPIEDLRKLARFVIFMQKADGSFYSKYIPSTVGRDDRWTSLYYPGEAALGLMMLYEHDPSPEWLQSAAKVIFYLAKKRANETKIEHDHWALLATAKILKYYDQIDDPKLSKEAVVKHAVQICEAIVALDASLPVDSISYGGFNSDGRTTPTATRLEGLLEAVTYLPPEYNQLKQKITARVPAAINFLINSQEKSGEYAGGIPRAKVNMSYKFMSYGMDFYEKATEIRIDYVQHALSAMIQYDTVFGESR